MTFVIASFALSDAPAHAQDATSTIVKTQVSAAQTQRESMARVHFEKAIEAMQASRWARAARLLDGSNTWFERYKTHYKLSQCYREMGRLASAYSALSRAEELARKEGQLQYADDFAKELAALKPLVPTLLVKVRPQDAKLSSLEIFLDGVIVPRSRWNHDLIMIDLGDHFVMATLNKEPKFSLRFREAEKGHTTTTLIELPAQPSRAAREQLDDRTWSRGMGWLGFGASVAFVALGGFLLHDAINDEHPNRSVGDVKQAFGAGALVTGGGLGFLGFGYELLRASSSVPPLRQGALLVLPSYSRAKASLDVIVRF